MTASFQRLTVTEQLWWSMAAIMAAMFAATLLAFWFDRRVIDGASVWAKPLKFEVSLALHFSRPSL